MISAPTITIAQAFVEGLQIDRASWNAGYAAAGTERERDCPAGLDLFSFYLGRAQARRFGVQARVAS